MLLGIAGCHAQEFPFADVDEWEDHASEIRDGIAERLEIAVDRDRPPVEVLVHGRRIQDGYVVENVAFASLPGFWVTGNLYRPIDARAPVPAVLVPHGHFEEDGWYARTRPEMQAIAAGLARAGAVAFTWDMVGWGDSTQLEHDSRLVPTLQTWNALRAVDFVLALPEVDPDRIAITGASGGASQGLVLTALDDRPIATVPVAMISATFPGGCSCEDLYPDGLHGTLEIAAMAAPRPQLVVSDDGDWTRLVPVREFPWLRGLYALYDAEHEVENVHLAGEGHDYGPSKRAATYGFFAERLELALADDAPPLPHAALVVFDNAHPRPADALVGEAAIAVALAHVTGAASR